jgi:hypothetical protein
MGVAVTQRDGGCAWTDQWRREQAMLLFKQVWLRLTTCAEKGCSNRAVLVDWCNEHTPADPEPDAWWGDPGTDPR